MNKDYLYVTESARIKPKHLPHQQLLIKVLLTIVLVSLALIAIYDNHAFVQTKITEYRSKLPSAEYPAKTHDYQSKYYDYENIVHEHVYDKNVKIDDNYIDIDYKADDENVYEEYSDEEIRDRAVSRKVDDTILQGAGFRNYNEIQSNVNTKAIGGPTKKASFETDNTPEVDGNWEKIYDETHDPNEEEEIETSDILKKTGDDVEKVDSVETLNRFSTNRIDEEKTDLWVTEKVSEIENIVTYKDKRNNSIEEVSTELIHEHDITGTIQSYINNIAKSNISQTFYHEPNTKQLEETKLQPKESINISNVLKTNLIYTIENDEVLKTITNRIQTTRQSKNIATANETTTQGVPKNLKDISETNENENFIIKANGEKVNKDISLFKYKIIPDITNDIGHDLLKANQVPSTKALPETSTKPDTYDIFRYSSKTSTNSTSPFQHALPVDRKFIRTSEELDKPPPVGRSFYYSRAKRRLPQALIIGVRKCGTRALLEMLYLHPRIQKAAGEVHFFDRDENYSKGLDWYRRQMPLSYPNQVTIEKSPSYFVTPEAPERIRAMNASIRLLVIVRDPVTRAISDYTQLKIHAAATSPGPVKKFEQLALRDNGEINENYRPVAVSMYHNYMYPWLEVFPKDQILIVNGDRLIEDPVPELQHIERFLNLEPRINHDNFYFNHTKGFYCLKNHTMERCLRESKGRKHVRVHPKVISKMREYFNYHNQLFYDLVEENFDWPEE